MERPKNFSTEMEMQIAEIILAKCNNGIRAFRDMEDFLFYLKPYPEELEPYIRYVGIQLAKNKFIIIG